MAVELARKPPVDSKVRKNLETKSRALFGEAALRRRRRKRIFFTAGLLLVTLLGTASCDRFKWFGPPEPKVAQHPAAADTPSASRPGDELGQKRP
jgi:hypothetical protein